MADTQKILASFHSFEVEKRQKLCFGVKAEGKSGIKE